MSGDVGPLDRVLERLGECSRVEQVAAARLLVDMARPWPHNPARTFVTTVTDAMLAGVDDLKHVVRHAQREYRPGPAKTEPHRVEPALWSPLRCDLADRQGRQPVG